MANNVNLQVNAIANFTQLRTQVRELRLEMENLQKTSLTAGTMGSKEFTKNSAAAMANFERMVGATKAFNIQSVKMNNAVDQFATKLERGQVGLQSSWKIWRQEAKGGAKMLDDLAARQTRLMKSTFIPDPNMTGYSKAITATKASMTELGAQADFARIRMSALNSVMREIGTGMVNFGKNTQWAGRQLTVGLTMPLVLFGQAASKAYISFDEQMTSMLKVYGAHAVVQSQQTLDQIEKSVTELADKTARTLGVAMTDTVQIAKTFSSIGLEGNNLISATEATTRLMKLGDLQAQQAAGSMVSLQNVFKLQGDQIKDAVNFLNAAKHSTSTTMQDIIDAIPRVGPIIQQMGGTYKDFVSFIVAMKESGVPAAQGANAIKSMLASIIKPTRQARDDFKGMGIDLQDLAEKNSNNVMGMVQGLQQSLNALPQAQRLKAIEELFGKFQFARVTALMNNLGTAGSQSAKVLELYGQTNDQLAAVAKQELEVATDKTPAAQMAKMKATLQADLIPIGKKFAESFITLGSGIDKIVKGFKKISDALGPISKIFGGLFTKGLVGLMIVGPVTMLVGLFVNLAGQIFKMVSFSRMFKQGMMDGGLKGAIAGISNYFQKVDLSVLAAKENTDLFKDSVISTADAFAALTANVEKLKLQLSYIAGSSIRGPLSGVAGAPMPQNLFSLTPSMPASAKGKMGGFVRPHMYPGSALREDWENMSPAEQAKYPNLMMAQSSMKPGQFSGTSGYLERGLTAQWKVAPQGVPSLANSIYGTSPAIYGGSTGIAKSDVLAKGTEGLIQKHNAIVLGIEKADALTTAQLEELFGKTVTKESSLSAEQRAKLERVLDTVIFEENAFKENMVDHLIQEQAILLSVQETGTTTNVDILINKLKSATQMEEAKRIPAISMAFEQFNSTLTALAMQEITQMRERMMMMMAGMGTGAAAMAGAELQTGISLAAEARGIEQMGIATAQDSSMLRQSIAINTGSVPRFATGGYVSGPGGPKDDKIPAMLSEGEYVVKAESVNKYGRGTLDALNNGYAAGGLVFASEGWEPTAGKTFAHMQENLTLTEEQINAFGRYVQEHGTVAMRQHWAVAQANGFRGLRAVGNLGFDISGPINSALPKTGVKPEILISDLNKRFSTGKNPYKTMLNRIGITDSVEVAKISNALHAQVIPQIESMRNLGLVKDADLYRVMPNLVESTLIAGGYQANVRDLYAMESMRLGRTPAELAKTLGLAENANLRGTQFRLQQRFAEAEKAGILGQELSQFANRMRMMRLPLANGGKIPAMLSNGEYVMSKNAVDRHGSDFISGINDGTAKLAKGGKIGNRFANSPMNLARGGILHAALGFDTRQNAGIRAYSEAVQPMNRAEIRAMSGMGPNAAGVNEARMQRALAAQEQAMAQFGMTIRETAASFATQVKAGALVVADNLDNSARLYGTLTKEAAVDAVQSSKSAAINTLEASKSAAMSLVEASKSAAMSLVEGGKVAAASIASGAMGGMRSAAGGISTGASFMGGRFKNAFSLKNMSMGKMMGGMIGGQVVGQALNSMAGGMQDGIGKSATSGAAMGAQMGAMFGPEGLAVGAAIGALGGTIFKSISQMKEKMAQAKAGLLESVTLDTNSIETLGIKIRNLGDISIVSSTQVGISTTKLQNAINSWKDSQDPVTQDALKNLADLASDVGSNRQKIEDLALAKYETLIGSGVKVQDANLEILSYLRAGGVGMLTAENMITKLSKFSDPNAAFGKILNTLVAVAPNNIPGQENRIIYVDEKTKQTPTYPTGPGTQDYGPTLQPVPISFQLDYSSEVVAKAITTAIQSEDPLAFTKYIQSIMASSAPLVTGSGKNAKPTEIATQKQMLNDPEVFKKYQEAIAKTNPDLEKFNNELFRSSVEGNKIYQIDTLMALGWQGDSTQAKYLTTDVKLLNQELQTYNAKQIVTNAISDYVSNTINNQAKAQKAKAQATTQATNSLQDQITVFQDYIDSESKIITGIQNEKSAYDKLYESQQQQITNQQTLNGLRDNITKANATGDLIAMAEAQNNYNIELAKQAEAKRKAGKDDFYDKEIAKHQTNIDKANNQIKTLNKQVADLSKTTTSATQDISDGMQTITTNTNSAATAVQTFLTGGNWSDKATFLSGLADIFSTELNIPLDTAKDLAATITSSLETTDGFNFDKIGGLHDSLYKASQQMGILSTTASGAFIQMEAMANMQAYHVANPGQMVDAKHFLELATANWKAHGYAGGTAIPTVAPTKESLQFNGTYSEGNWYQDPYNQKYYWQLGHDNNFNKTPKTLDQITSKKKPLLGWRKHIYNYNQASGYTELMAEGGLMTSFGMGTNGIVRGPGGPKSDMIPTMLSNGEYVVKASAVGQYGVGLLNAINNQEFSVPRISNVPTGVGNSSSNSSLSDNSVYNITVHAATNADPNEIARTVMKTLKSDSRSLSISRNVGVVG